MQNVYKVEFEMLTQNQNKGTLKKKRPDWQYNNEAIRVLSNGTVQAAVKKAERFLLSRVEPWEDDDGTPMIERTLKVRITSCEHVLTLDA